MLFFIIGKIRICPSNIAHESHYLLCPPCSSLPLSPFFNFLSSFISTSLASFSYFPVFLLPSIKDTLVIWYQSKVQPWGRRFSFYFILFFICLVYIDLWGSKKIHPMKALFPPFVYEGIRLSNWSSSSHFQESWEFMPNFQSFEDLFIVLKYIEV